MYVYVSKQVGYVCNEMPKEEKKKSRVCVYMCVMSGAQRRGKGTQERSMCMSKVIHSGFDKFSNIRK